DVPELEDVEVEEQLAMVPQETKKTYKPKIEMMDDEDEDTKQDGGSTRLLIEEVTTSQTPQRDIQTDQKSTRLLIEEVATTDQTSTGSSQMSYEATQNVHSEELLGNLGKIAATSGKQMGTLQFTEEEKAIIDKKTKEEKISDLAANAGSTDGKKDALNKLLWNDSELD
ncbi:uncharacterized protein LOC110441260, partial [Mizuhopecten yessoensis]|uniref:uncharacterized protein LOC110441260 n=1 Tax=Mizuhopecten yessoensis TaxID=6573 RepID=UPI000B45AD3B